MLETSIVHYGGQWDVQIECFVQNGRAKLLWTLKTLPVIMLSKRV